MDAQLGTMYKKVTAIMYSCSQALALMHAAFSALQKKSMEYRKVENRPGDEATLNNAQTLELFVHPIVTIAFHIYLIQFACVHIDSYSIRCLVYA